MPPLLSELEESDGAATSDPLGLRRCAESAAVSKCMENIKLVPFCASCSLRCMTSSAQVSGRGGCRRQTREVQNQMVVGRAVLQLRLKLVLVQLQLGLLLVELVHLPSVTAAAHTAVPHRTLGLHLQLVFQINLLALQLLDLHGEVLCVLPLPII